MRVVCPRHRSRIIAERVLLSPRVYTTKQPSPEICGSSSLSSIVSALVILGLGRALTAILEVVGVVGLAEQASWRRVQRAAVVIQLRVR